MIEKIQQAVAVVVPPAKGIVWIAATGFTLFMAGVGWTVRASKFTSLPPRVDSLTVQAARHERELVALRASVDSASADRRQILCLVTLSATGVDLSPLEVRERCP